MDATGLQQAMASIIAAEQPPLMTPTFVHERQGTVKQQQSQEGEALFAVQVDAGRKGVTEKQ